MASWIEAVSAAVMCVGAVGAILYRVGRGAAKVEDAIARLTEIAADQSDWIRQHDERHFALAFPEENNGRARGGRTR